jgi:predicted nucleic acid-binding protein
MIALDTTVLVYAVGSEHALRDPCRRLLAAARVGTIQASTTVEVIQEFVHVRARRRDRADAVEIAQAYAALLSPLLVANEECLLSALRLFRDNGEIGAFDAVLAAAAVGAKAEALVSADRGFARVAELNHVVPDSEGVASLLGNA